MTSPRFSLTAPALLILAIVVVSSSPPFFRERDLQASLLAQTSEESLDGYGSNDGIGATEHAIFLTGGGSLPANTDVYFICPTIPKGGAPLLLPETASVTIYEFTPGMKEWALFVTNDPNPFPGTLRVFGEVPGGNDSLTKIAGQRLYYVYTDTPLSLSCSSGLSAASPGTTDAIQREKENDVPPVPTSTANSRQACQWNAPAMQDFSNDGRWMTFHALSDGNIAGENEQDSQIYLFDTQERVTRKMTDETNNGKQPLAGGYPKISGNGKFITFLGLPTGQNGSNSDRRIMLLNLETNEYSNVSSGFTFYGPSDISDDGRYVLYRENCLNLYDRTTDSTVMITGLLRDINGGYIPEYCTKAARNPTTQDPLLQTAHASEAFLTGDGRTVFFTAADPGPHNGFWFPGETMTQSLYRYSVGSTDPPVRVGPFDGGGIVMDGNGAVMYFMRGPGKRSVYRQSTDLNSPATIVNPGNNAVDDGGLYLYSTTYDGRMISAIGGPGQHLLVFNGTNTVVDFSTYFSMSTSFAPLSPDGRFLTYTNHIGGDPFAKPGADPTMTYTFRRSTFNKSDLFLYDIAAKKTLRVPLPGAVCQ
jgi:hypothetical protein